MRLRVDSSSGLPANEYRINHGRVEFRILGSAPERTESLTAWKILDEKDVALHYALDTVVSKWLRVRMPESRPEDLPIAA